MPVIRAGSDDKAVSLKNIKTEIRLCFEHDLIKVKGSRVGNSMGAKPVQSSSGRKD